MENNPYPNFRPLVTTGVKYEPAMKITDQADADHYFERCVEHTMSFGKTREEAAQIERTNLGYYAGYYGPDVRDRVERLFHCQHPYFGPIAVNGQPTPATAYNIGFTIGALASGKPL